MRLKCLKRTVPWLLIAALFFMTGALTTRALAATNSPGDNLHTHQQHGSEMPDGAQADINKKSQSEMNNLPQAGGALPHDSSQAETEHPGKNNNSRGLNNATPNWPLIYGFIILDLLIIFAAALMKRRGRQGMGMS